MSDDRDPENFMDSEREEARSAERFETPVFGRRPRSPDLYFDGERPSAWELREDDR